MVLTGSPPLFLGWIELEISVFMMKDAESVGVDELTLGVQPRLAGADVSVCGHRDRGERRYQQGSETGVFELIHKSPVLALRTRIAGNGFIDRWLSWSLPCLI